MTITILKDNDPIAEAIATSSIIVVLKSNLNEKQIILFIVSIIKFIILFIIYIITTNFFH